MRINDLATDDENIQYATIASDTQSSDLSDEAVRKLEAKTNQLPQDKPRQSPSTSGEMVYDHKQLNQTKPLTPNLLLDIQHHPLQRRWNSIAPLPSQSIDSPWPKHRHTFLGRPDTQ